MAQPARFVAVITGCSQGLGLHAAAELAAADPTIDIVLACRNLDSAKAAVETIIAKHPAVDPSRLVVLDAALQLDDIDSVRVFCKCRVTNRMYHIHPLSYRIIASALRAHLSERGQIIKILINNAGVGGMPVLKPTRQGFDTIFATNHLGHFLLTLLLLPSSVAAVVPSTLGDDAPHLRIVNVSSEVWPSALWQSALQASTFVPPCTGPRPGKQDAPPRPVRALACGRRRVRREARTRPPCRGRGRRLACIRRPSLRALQALQRLVHARARAAPVWGEPAASVGRVNGPWR